MLRKLLKYDMASVWKIWVALAGSVLGMSVITSLIIRMAIEGAVRDDDPLFVLSFLVMGLVVFAMIMIWAAMLLVTPLMCYIRYYRNFFSDEGYLTFTLPVSRRDLYVSKVLNAFIFGVGNVLVTIVTVLIMMLIIPPATEEYPLINPVAYQTVAEWIGELCKTVGGWIFVYILEILLVAVAVPLYSIGLYHLCITVGATVAKKHKVLAALGIYCGTTFALSTVSQVFSIFSGQSIVGLVELISTRPATLVNPVVSLLGLLIAVVVLTIAAILHLVTLNTIERKLNLA